MAVKATPKKPTLSEKILAFSCSWAVTTPICVINGMVAFIIGNAILAVNTAGYLSANKSAAEGALGGLVLSPLVTIFSILDYCIIRGTTDDRGWNFREWLLPTSRQLFACQGLSLAAGVVGHAILNNRDLIHAIQASSMGMLIYSCGLYAIYFICTCGGVA